MTHIVQDPETFAEVALAGFCDAYSHIVMAVPGGALRSTKTKAGKVVVVIGGGSGHYPAFAGYVGRGFADAAVAGDVFASPSTQLVYQVSKQAHQGAGMILGFGNYAGDVLNFGFAAERLRGEGIDVRVLAVTDDVASAPASEEAKRRGVAGDIPVFKIAGASAERGDDLDTVERLARLANARTRSFGIAFGGCTLPGAHSPLFTVPEGKMALGLGIHGEPGIQEIPMGTANEIAALLVARVLGDAPANAGRRAGVLLNGLGSTKYEELFALWIPVRAALEAAGIDIVAPQIGELVTSLDMEGCSLTLTWLDDDLEPLWLAPCDTAALRIGLLPEAERAEALPEQSFERTAWPDASPASQSTGRVIANAMEHLATVMRDAEEELGRIDAVAGDGDHGQGMRRGAAAAATAARNASAAGAGAASVLAAGADAWANRAGGTSGVIWGLGLRSASAALDDGAAPSAKQVGQAVMQALQNVMRLGGAKVGDKTLIDAFEPFARTLTQKLDAGAAGRDAWAGASQAAHDAAEATTGLVPRLGRARPLAERSRGQRDAGAVSFALAARAMLAATREP